jgi:glucokinase
MLLAGDIGGTKTNLALFASKDDLRSPMREAKFPSGQYATLAALVHDFMAQLDLPDVKIERAVFGVAGPVENGKAKITNLPWQMEEEQLQRALNIPHVTLLNDLAAMGHAVPLLRQSDIHVVNAGKPAQHGTIGLVAPGTGLGEGMLTWDGENYRVHPSEGGHSDFAPTNAFEIGLLVYMLEKLPHVSYEHVCSGIGLPNIYAYMKDSMLFEEPEWLARKLAEAKDLTPVIASCALDDRKKEEENGQKAVSICYATIRTFVSILGAEAGNMALKVLASGGIYISGGISPRILPFFESDDFMRAFKNKGRFADMLADIPVYIVLDPNIGIMGSAAYGFRM